MLYRFDLTVSDVDRGVYDSVSLRVARHPSESLPYLLTRVLAFALNLDPALEFSPGGLNDPDAPALRQLSPHGSIDLWIDVGNPSARRLHKASKAADRVIVYTYKSAAALVAQIDADEVHRAADIRCFAIDAKFLGELELTLAKSNAWTILHQDGRIDVEAGGQTYACEIEPFALG